MKLSPESYIRSFGGQSFLGEGSMSSRDMVPSLAFIDKVESNIDAFGFLSTFAMYEKTL